MAIYNFHEIEGRDERLAWALVETVSQLTDKEMVGVDPLAIEVELAIAGHEVRFDEFVQRFFDQIDHLVDDRARALVNERMAVINDHICELEDAVLAVVGLRPDEY